MSNINKSESIGALAGALAKAQGQIAGAIKDKANPFFKSKYADLGAVTEAIKKPLSDHGLSYVQISHDRENAAAFETIIMHESGEWISCGVFSCPVAKADAQGYGSASTYCRRYSLQAAFGVPAEDDDGNDAAHAATPARKHAAPPPPKTKMPNDDIFDHEKRITATENHAAATAAWKEAEKSANDHNDPEALQYLKHVYASHYRMLTQHAEVAA